MLLDDDDLYMMMNNFLLCRVLSGAKSSIGSDGFVFEKNEVAATCTSIIDLRKPQIMQQSCTSEFLPQNYLSGG